MEVVSDRTYHFAAEPDAVWQAMAGVDEYPSWWPWLERFDGSRVAAGERWHCVVRPPVPYRVRFEVLLEEVESPSMVQARVTGDIRGTARLDITAGDGSSHGDRAGGSTVRLRADLAPAHPALQLLARFARPLVRFGHDWVIDSGARQFSEHVARAATGPTDDPASDR